MRGRRAALLAATLLLGLVGGGMTAVASTPAAAPEVLTEPVGSPFTDIGPAATLYPDVLWMYMSGITTGWPDGTFRPMAPVTRGAVAAFLYRWVFLTADTPACDAGPRAFSDVPATNPFCGAIEWLADLGVVNGYTDGTYRPTAPITRGAFLALLMRGVGTDSACSGNVRPFSDVTIAHPLCGYIETAAAEGITTGWPDGTFRPTLLIQRQAVAAMLHRAEVLRVTKNTHLAGTFWAATES